METVFVIPAKAGIQFFALDPCFRRGDIVGFRFPQQILIKNKEFVMRQFKIVVEKHPDGYMAYPLGLKGVVVGQGDTYEEVLAISNI